jgi:hypothetical protein
VITNQIEKECITRDATLEKYIALISKVESLFKGFTVEYIERNKNFKVDELVKVITQKTTLHPNFFFQTIEEAYVKTRSLH